MNKKLDTPTSFSKPIIIAHRGASGYEPENTLLSFEQALKMGSNGIELDVFLAKTGEIVVIHDETIDRTTNGQGYVNELSWSKLKKYDAGKGEHIPLLSEVLDLIRKHYQKQIPLDFLIDIELKESYASKPVAELISYYIDHKNWKANNFIVSSFDHNAIQEFKNCMPKIKTAAIFFRSRLDLIQVTKQSNAQFLVLDYQSITSIIINKAHSKGLSVFTYTVNDSFIAQELASWGIDGIITDYPDILDNFDFDPRILH